MHASKVPPGLRRRQPVRWRWQPGGRLRARKACMLSTSLCVVRTQMCDAGIAGITHHLPIQALPASAAARWFNVSVVAWLGYPKAAWRTCQPDLILACSFCPPSAEVGNVRLPLLFRTSDFLCCSPSRYQLAVCPHRELPLSTSHTSGISSCRSCLDGLPAQHHWGVTSWSQRPVGPASACSTPAPALAWTTKASRRQLWATHARPGRRDGDRLASALRAGRDGACCSRQGSSACGADATACL